MKRIAIHQFDDGLPRGDEDFRRHSRIGPTPAMDAAVGREEFKDLLLDDLQGPGRGGGVGVQILDVGPQQRAYAAILANQRREVGLQASGEHGRTKTRCYSR